MIDKLNVPSSAQLASILDAVGRAPTWLLSGRSAAAEEAIHLSDEHLQHLLAAFDVLEPREGMGCGQDTVGVDTRLAVQTVPDDRRQVEQNRLDFARQIYTSVIQAKFIS